MYPRTQRHLGSLLALYEHSVWCRLLLGHHSFDQFGVELGKKMASNISIGSDKAPSGPGADGIARVIGYIRSHRKT